MLEKNEKIFKRFTSKGVFPHQFAFTLLIPIRNIFLSPKELIKRLALKNNFRVLEIGPGPGYFSVSIAKFLTYGKLDLLDIQQEMLDYAKKRIQKKGLLNVDYHLGDGKSLKFLDELFDRILMVTVIGEVENQKNYLEEIHRVLKKDGILSISELAGDPDKLSIKELTMLIEPVGFKLVQQFGNYKNYTANFCKT